MSSSDSECRKGAEPRKQRACMGVRRQHSPAGARMNALYVDEENLVAWNFGQCKVQKSVSTRDC